MLYIKALYARGEGGFHQPVGRCRPFIEGKSVGQGKHRPDSGWENGAGLVVV